MSLAICRDCGREGEEGPDDPAPNLCPPCYDARLGRISDKFPDMCELLQGNERAICGWLEQQLVDVGGELPAHAHAHAGQLYLGMHIMRTLS